MDVDETTNQIIDILWNNGFIPEDMDISVAENKVKKLVKELL